MGYPGGRPLAVVTGASSGIGYELARIFAESGYDLIVAAEDRGIRAAASALREYGVAAKPVQVDLATYEGVEALYAALGGRSPDAVAFNAGIAAGGDFTRDIKLDADLKVIDLNVRSTVHLAKRVLADMVTRGSGKALFTSGVTARMPGPYEATYAAAASFILSFAEAVRYELRDTGVSVTTLMPGPTDTGFFDRAGLTGTKLAALEDKDDPREVAREGFAALMEGRDLVIAGAGRNRLQAAAAKMMSEAKAAKLRGQLAEPGSAG